MKKLNVSRKNPRVEIGKVARAAFRVRCWYRSPIGPASNASPAYSTGDLQSNSTLVRYSEFCSDLTAPTQAMARKKYSTIRGTDGASSGRIERKRSKRAWMFGSSHGSGACPSYYESRFS